MTSPPQLRRFVRRTLEGMQRPPIFEADDRHEYVLKLDSHDRDFPAAELVAAHLAVAFGVPLPPFAVLDAPALLTAALSGSGDSDCTEFAESFTRLGGSCFGSRHLGAATTRWTAASHHIFEGADAILGRLLVFDAFIENADRSSATNPNLLVNGGRLYAIDHGQGLPGVQGLTGKKLPFPFDSHISWDSIRQRPSLLDQPIQDLRDLGEDAIHSAIEAVPEEWWTAPDRARAARADLLSHRDALPATLETLRKRLS
jgi:hypothetical protein